MLQRACGVRLICGQYGDTLMLVIQKATDGKIYLTLTVASLELYGK